MNRQELVKEIFDKKSFLCVGLDTDINKIPDFLREKKDAIFEFNKAIIDAINAANPDLLWIISIWKSRYL